MIRIKFQNGPDAPEIFLDHEEFETGDEASKRLDSIIHAYGTVPEAVGWAEGSVKPKFGDFAHLFATAADDEAEVEEEEEPSPLDVNLDEALDLVAAASADDLDALEALEKAGRDRKTLLEAIDARRAEVAP